MKKNRLVAFLLCLCMVFALAACSGGQSAEETKPTEAPQTEPEAEPEAEPEGEPEAEPETEPEAEPEAEPAIDWPGNDTITVVCPYGAGGDTDFMARLVFEKVQERLGGNFIVQNITGNTGTVGAQQVLDSEPDGKTLLFFHTAMLVTHATGVAPFSYEDFDMVCIAGDKSNGQYFMRADNPYGITDYPSLKAYTQEHPGELLITYEAGGTSHLGTQMFVNSGVDATMVDIGGKSEQLAALLSGQVDIAALAMGTAQEYVDSGEFICLGYVGEESPLYDPDKYPCLSNYGVTDNWKMNYTLFAPKGTDPAIIKLLSDTIGDICANDEDYAQRMADAFYIMPIYHDTEDAIKEYQEQEKLLEDYVQYLLA